MAVQCKPIPALYTVYILRSTVRHASLYIGSTPNPPRRLSQHNGLVHGGAARTSRASLRPWEMLGLVSGFPSMTAALKFEWALNNPHLSVHIPASSRLAVSSQTKKRNGRPRRPPKSLASVASSLHLLLRVPSFARWPLAVRFFSADLNAAWERWCAAATENVRPSLSVVADFAGPEERETAATAAATASAPAPIAAEDGHGDGEGKGVVVGEAAQPAPSRGIHALPLDYEPIKEYVAKGQGIFEFERQGSCVVCREELPVGEGLQAVCANPDCDGVGHLTCWSRHFLQGEADEVVPVQGRCPKCRAEVLWGDMMKELTLRVRGEKEVEKLLKGKRRRVAKKTTRT